ncbi:MAG: FeoA family protein [Bacillota bacterium]
MAISLERARGTALIRMKTGATGRISHLAAQDPKRTRRLLALGIRSGVRIRLVQRIPAYVVEIGYTRVAMDEQVARDIFVDLDPPGK